MLRNDFDVLFASFNAETGHPSEMQLSQIAEAGAQWLPLTGTDREQFDADFLAQLRHDDIAVLDNYYFTTAYQQSVRDRVRALVYIDDMHGCHSVADVVMTFCPLRREDFDLEPYTRFYGGIERAFLRPAFLENTEAALQKSTEAVSLVRGAKLGNERRVLVMMGGADPFRLTDKMIRIAVAEGLTPVHEGIIKGCSPEQIRDMFDAADLAILPMSTVCTEAFARHTPVIGGWFVDNQHELYDYCVEHRYISPLGCLLDDEETLRSRLHDILSNGVTPAPQIDFVAKREETIEIFRSL
jgi:hypothetical protein